MDARRVELFIRPTVQVVIEESSGEFVVLGGGSNGAFSSLDLGWSTQIRRGLRESRGSQQYVREKTTHCL